MLLLRGRRGKAAQLHLKQEKKKREFSHPVHPNVICGCLRFLLLYPVRADWCNWYPLSNPCVLPLLTSLQLGRKNVWE